MSNLHSLSAIAKQRKKRTLWRNLVVCFAALVVFCTTYALILPAITMEQEGYSCGLQEHTHTPDCYRLTCGKQEAYTHTHTKPDCYDADGNLTCTLKQQTLHRHTQDCYSKPQPVCGLAEAAPHAHEDACYTEGELTCTLAETQGHTHGQDCYPAKFTPELICGQQELPEHRHTAACYTLTCQQQEHTHTDACVSSHEAFLENLLTTGPTAGPEQPAAEPETPTADSQLPTEPQPEPAEQPTVAPQPTEADAPTNPEAPTQEPTDPEAPAAEPETPAGEAQDVPQPEQEPALLLAKAPPQSTFESNLVKVAGEGNVSVTGDNLQYVPGQYVNGTYVEAHYTMSFELNFTLETARGWDGTYYIVDKSATGSWNVASNTLTFNLGKAELAGNVNYDCAYPMEQDHTGESTYKFVKNADGTISVEIKLGDKYVEGAAGGITGKITLSGSVGKDEGLDDGSVKHPTGEGIDVVVRPKQDTYPENETNKGKVDASKDGSFVFDGNKLIYTVKVTTGDDGTPGPVEIKDIFNFDGAALTELDIAGPTEVTVNGQTYEPSVTTADGKTEISMTLPKLSKGGSHTIQYVFTVGERPELDTKVKNKVSVVSKPSEDGQPAQVEKEKEITVPNKDTTEPDPEVSLEKWNGWNDSNRNDGKTVIPWVIRFNGSKLDIAGKVLSDSYIVKNSKGEQQSSSNLDFNAILADAEHSMTVTVNGNQLAREDFEKHFEVINGSLHFKATDGEENKNTYEIIYYTPAPDIFGEWGGGSVTNTAEVDGKTATSTVQENANSVSKSGQGVEARGDDKLHMKWKVDINLTGVGIKTGEGYAIQDNAHAQGYDRLHYYDRGSVKLTYNGTLLMEDVDYELKFYNEKDGSLTDGDSTYMEVIMLKEYEPRKTEGDILTMEYESFVDSKQGGTYHNTVVYHETTAESWQDVKPDSIRKTDGNGTETGTTVKDFNGELTWKINAVVGNVTKTKTITVTDTLPDNVDVLKLSAVSRALHGSDLSASLTVDEQTGVISGENADFIFSGTCVKSEAGNFVVTLVATRKDGQDIEPDTSFTFQLDCQVASEYVQGNEDGTFTNTATGKTDQGEIGSSSQTQVWEKKKENIYEDAMSKALISPKNMNYLDYQLVINPDGLDLQPDSSVVYLVDEFSYNPQKGTADLVFDLVRGTVRLYEAVKQADGSFEKGSEILTGWRWTSSENDPTDLFPNEKITKIIRLEVPDFTPLILEYRYALTSYSEQVKNDKEYHLDAVNKAYFTADPSQSESNVIDEAHWELGGSSGVISTDRYLQIIKVDESNTAVYIPGTKFAVQSWNGTDWVAVSGMESVETDSKGELMIKGFGETLDVNVLYRLIEREAAPGYIFNADSPPVVKFFYYTADRTEPEGYPRFTEIPDELKEGAVDLSEVSASQYITNKADKAKFSVKKLWHYEDGSTVANPPAVQLQLVRVATEQQQSALVNDPLANTASVTLSVCKWNEGDEPACGSAVYTVPKGTVLTVTVNQPSVAQSNPKIELALGSEYKTITPAITTSASGDSFTFQYTVKYNVRLVVRTNDYKEGLTFSCSYPGQSTGETGGSSGSDDVLETVDVEGGIITLDSSNNWTWSSVDHPDLVPIQGEYQKENGEKCKVWYSYYVREISGGSYEVHYSNESGEDFISVSTGTITVTNTVPVPTPTSLTVKKQWEGLGSLDTESVSFELFQKEWKNKEDFTKAMAGDYSAHGVTFGMTDEDIAKLENGTLTRLGTYSLNLGDGWTWSSIAEGLTLHSSINGRYYTYFIVEQPGDFTTTYTPEVSSGTITVTNTTEKKPTRIQVDKQWFDYFGKDANYTVNVDEVEFELYRVAYVGENQMGEPVLVGTYKVTKTGNWTWNSDDEPTLKDNPLPAKEYKVESEGESDEPVGKTYIYSYYIREIRPENAGYSVRYWSGKAMLDDSSMLEFSDKPNPITSGIFIIRNTLESPKYQLPQTGGTGAAPLRLAGLTLALTAACLLHRKRKTRPQ